jgi:hypothetical protein
MWGVASSKALGGENLPLVANEAGLTFGRLLGSTIGRPASFAGTIPSYRQEYESHICRSGLLVPLIKGCLG